MYIIVAYIMYYIFPHNCVIAAITEVTSRLHPVIHIWKSCCCLLSLLSLLLLPLMMLSANYFEIIINAVCCCCYILAVVYTLFILFTEATEKQPPYSQCTTHGCQQIEYNTNHFFKLQCTYFGNQTDNQIAT